MTALVARASNPMTIIPIRFDLIHSQTTENDFRRQFNDQYQTLVTSGA
jgi:hypothetical protein